MNFFEFLRFYLLISTLILIVGCKSGPTRVSEPKLINGYTAEDSQFPSSVRIDAGRPCTATKVGPHLFLTAAHCLRIEDGNYYLTYGIKLWLARGQKPVVSTINHFFIHPSHEIMPWMPTKSDEVKKVSDVALFRVNVDSPDIPLATIGLTLEPNRQIKPVGFGCTEREGEPSDILRYTDGIVGEISDHVFNIDPQIITPGMAKLCEGDSGGGVFYTDSNTVIGVNVLSSSTTIGVATRIDADSKNQVYNWIQAIVDGDKQDSYDAASLCRIYLDFLNYADPSSQGHQCCQYANTADQFYTLRQLMKGKRNTCPALIEDAKTRTSLILNGTQLRDIRPVRVFSNLETLDVSYNKHIQDYNVIHDLPNLSKILIGIRYEGLIERMTDKSINLKFSTNELSCQDLQALCRTGGLNLIIWQSGAHDCRHGEPSCQ